MRSLFLFAATFAGLTLEAADPTLLNLAMPDSKVLAGINVTRAKTSPFGQFLLTQMPVGDEFAGFIKATGFDPRQDLEEVLIASNAQTKQNGLVMLRGTFHPDQIAANIAPNQATEIYKGATVITSGKNSGAVAFLSSNVAVLGDVGEVKAAVDRSTNNNTLDPNLAAKAASYSAADAWSVSIAPIVFGPMGEDAKNNPLGNALKSLQQASGSIQLSTPVQINAEAQADNDQNATSLSDVLKFFVAMLQTGNNVPDIFKTLNITTDHSTIRVQLSIPEDQLEQFVKGVQAGAEHSTKKPLGQHVE